MYKRQPLNGFAGTVVFSASVTSTSGYFPNLLFSSTSITLPATTSTTLTLTGITADLRMPSMPGQTGSGTMYAGKTPWYAAGSGVTVASLLLLTLPRRRRLGGLLVLALSVAIGLGATGCGTNTATASGTGTNTSPYAGQYVVTVTGTATISGVDVYKRQGLNRKPSRVDDRLWCWDDSQSSQPCLAGVCRKLHGFGSNSLKHRTYHMRCSSLPWLRPTLVSTFAALLLTSLAFGAGVPAAFAVVQNRITTQVSGSRSIEIPNSVHPRVALATDLGPTSGDTKLLGMSLRFNMTTAQQAALDQLLVDQQDPASPRYYQWLTPALFGAQFGLSSADIAQVTAWLTSQGFTVTGVANGGTFVTFDGTVAQANAAFSTSVHNLSVNGETHYANVTNTSVPGAFAGVVSAITGLHNFRMKPHIKASSFSPQYTSTSSSSLGQHFLAPGDIYTIYDVNPLLTAGFNGAGETIAVTGQVDIYQSDVLAFRSASGLSTTNLPTVVHIGSEDPGYPTCDTQNCEPNDNDLEEASLDVEWSGAMAPSATILFVNGYDVFFNAMTGAIDQDLAPIVTTSYGGCEAGQGTTELNALNQLFKQANAQGQTILAAAADEGATDCDTGTSRCV